MSEQPVTINPEDPDPNSPHNTALAAIDGIVSVFPPQEQIGVLMMATVLATRRLLVANAIFDRPRRLHIIREAVHQFDKRMRKYVWGK